MDGRPTTHYVKSDDVHVAYQVFGEGPLDLLFVPGFVSNIEAIWASAGQRAFFERLASFSRLRPELANLHARAAHARRPIHSRRSRIEASGLVRSVRGRADVAPL